MAATLQITQAIQQLSYLSGQKKDTPISDIEHSYAKAWYRRPNNQRVRPTRYLFLKNFPRHFLSSNPFGVDTTSPDGFVDVGSADDLKKDLNPQAQLMIDEMIQQNLEKDQQQQQPTEAISDSGNQQNDPTVVIKQEHSLATNNDESSSNEQTLDTRYWTQQMERLYFKTFSVLQNDYLTRLIYESRPNESIHRLNLMEYTSIQIRHLFANIAGWDADLLTWLHTLLTTDNTNHTYLVEIYHQVMQYLRLKLPSLIDKFYPTAARLEANQVSLTQAPVASADDPVAKLLIKNKSIPKRLPGGPIFMVVPCGPNMSSQQSSSRKEFWRQVFSSLGLLVSINIPFKPEQTSSEVLATIKLAVRDKIKDLRRKKSNETRPIVLVGFNHGSMVAIHCALENPGQIVAIICLGFSLGTIGGVRGDLNDPLIDTTIPILFVVGHMSSTTNLEDMERFRELMTRSETGLIVVGGANDKLVVCYEKKLSDGITQAMVDKCIGDEIYDFVNSVLNPRSEPAKLRLDLN